MHKRIDWTFLLILAALVSALVVGEKFVLKTVEAQTIPTRTPTPPPGEPSETPGDDGNGGSGPGPLPTSTDRPPAPTATNTPVAIPATPEGGFLATATSCDPNPVVQSLASGTNVRSGPGTDYEAIGQLLYLEVRPIIGRAEFTQWWQIVLSDGEPGWVADEVVAVSGYIDDVPLVAPPALASGATPTPGTAWRPTPQPNCTPSPSVTATPSATPTGTETVAPTETGTATPAEADGVTGASEEEREEATATSVIPTPEGTATLDGNEDALALPGQPTVTPAPLAADANAGGSIPWLPIAGISLILAASLLFVFRRFGS